ncbi:FkbM family methyltransferase [Brevundimonas aurifodinae]
MTASEGSLVGLNELLSFDRWTLERRSRALCQTAFLGYQVTLCRVLGRYKLYMPTTDIGFGAHMMLDGFWEPWLTVFMAQRLKPGMHVVDAGANHGYYTVLFADIVGTQGRVAAIEANPNTAKFLRQTLYVNGFDDRVTVIEKALGDVDGRAITFETPSSEPKNARIVADSEAGSEGTIQVTSARLDTLLADWPTIDFIKLDVEGAEEAALAGASGILQAHRPELLVEFNSHRCQDAAGLLDRLEALYGHAPHYVNHDSALTPVSRAELLDPLNREDWMLSFKRA